MLPLSHRHINSFYGAHTMFWGKEEALNLRETHYPNEENMSNILFVLTTCSFFSWINTGPSQFTFSWIILTNWSVASSAIWSLELNHAQWCWIAIVIWKHQQVNIVHIDMDRLSITYNCNMSSMTWLTILVFPYNCG